MSEFVIVKLRSQNVIVSQNCQWSLGRIVTIRFLSPVDLNTVRRDFGCPVVVIVKTLRYVVTIKNFHSIVHYVIVSYD